MGKRFAAVGMAAALGVGGLAVAAVNPLTTAGAQDGTTTTAPAAPSTDGSHRDGPLQRALDELVAKGTLTQEQADAVVATTKEEAKQGRADRKEKRQKRRTEVLQAAADAIGSTPDEVKAGLKAGTSIAEQAEAEGVSRQTVDDALTAALTERIDQAVADGKLSADQATKAKSHLDKVVDRILDADGQGGAGGQGGFRRHLRGRFGN